MYNENTELTERLDKCTQLCSIIIAELQGIEETLPITIGGELLPVCQNLYGSIIDEVKELKKDFSQLEDALSML